MRDLAHVIADAQRPARVPFNYTALNNLAVRQIEAPLLLFLNDDTTVVNAEWLTALGRGRATAAPWGHTRRRPSLEWKRADTRLASREA